MTTIRHGDRDLHDANGERISTPPTADGHQLALYEQRILRHLADHRPRTAASTEALASALANLITTEGWHRKASSFSALHDVIDANELVLEAGDLVGVDVLADLDVANAAVAAAEAMVTWACSEGDHPNDDNPGQPMCRTCQEWIVR